MVAIREKATARPLQDARERTAGKGLWSGPQAPKKGMVQMPHVQPSGKKGYESSERELMETWVE